MKSKINIIALVAAIASIVLIAVSVYVPWWQLNVGNGSLIPAQANFSPVNFNVAIFGQLLTMPLIWALNVASLLTLLSGAIVLLIYSVKPDKSYSKNLLGFGYKKPLYAVIMFVVELLVLYFSVKTFAGFSFPLMGSATLQIPVGGDVTIGAQIQTAFLWPFYFGIVVAALCVAARLYHKKVVTQISTPVTTTAPAATVSPSTQPQTTN